MVVGRLCSLLLRLPAALLSSTCVRPHRRGLWGSQVGIVVGLATLGVQLLLLQQQQGGRGREGPRWDGPEELGDELYYGRTRLGVHYAHYASSVVHKLVLRPNVSDVVSCDGTSHDLHKVGGLPIRRTGLYQSLGDTNVHGLGAWLDDRLPGRRVLRVLATGLHPGPGPDVFCHYKCARAPKAFCSAQAYAVILLAGNYSDYLPDWDRESLQNVISLSCAVPPEDTPLEVSLSLTQCGFSHNSLQVTSLQAQGVQVPPRDLGVCVRPLRGQAGLNMNARKVALWLEYLRRQGTDQVYLYHSTLSATMRRMLAHYEKETFSLMTTTNWTAVDTNVDSVVSEEAAVNHCIYTNMMRCKYILVLSMDQWPAVSTMYGSLKQLVRSEHFQRKVNQFGGFRVSSSGRPMLLVKARLVLATAAKHFIALLGRPSFRELDAGDVAGTGREDVHIEPVLEELVQDKVKLGQF